jgi:hypothetical protein
MNKPVNDWITKTFWPSLKKRWFYIFVAIFYLFFCWYYMGPSFTHCSDRIYGFGDSTGGPIWSNSLKPGMPLLGGQEQYTNYPVGDNLYSPINYATVTQALLMKTTSKIAGPVCGYNLINILGYMTTSLAMFGFILYLTKKSWIALVAGYAVAFTPYFQSKVGGHPSYGFAALLIVTLWLILHIIREQKLKHGIMLAAVLAFCTYFDPYFILLEATVIAPILAIWALYVFKHRREKRLIDKSRKTFKVFITTLGILIVLVLPIAFVRIHDAKAINATTSLVRGDVKVTAMQCSNLPLDYLLPDARNYFMLELFGPNYVYKNISHRHWCGFGESRVTISLIMLTTILLTLIIFGWERLNNRRLKLHKLFSYNPYILIYSLLGIMLFSFLLGLPPEIRGIPTLSEVVIKVTATWRIFAREYLVLNTVVVMLFAIALTYFSSLKFKHSRYILPGLLVVLFLGIAAEYQITAPFQPLTFSYSQDVPNIYKQIRDDKKIDVIAEYPLDRLGIEADSNVYYLTMQTVHQKKIFNSAIVNDSREKIHISMKDLTDPQTLAALRYMGIKYVVIHGSTEDYVNSKSNQLKIISHEVPPIYALTMVHSNQTNDTILAEIVDGPKTDHVLTIQKGFVINLDIMKTPLDSDFEIVQNTELKLVPLSGGNRPNIIPACFEAKASAEGDSASLTIYVNGKPSQEVNLSDQYTPINVNAKEGDTILLRTSNGHNLRLNNLGCV